MVYRPLTMDNKYMNIPSLIFFLVFVLPLVAFLIWVMRQDKRKGITGLIVLAVIVIGGIAYMFWKTKGQ
jgi:cbb3-type cytochrome oxidase subunit 3